MSQDVTNIGRALSSFDDLWSPRVLIRVNDWDVRLAKVKGEFVWHAHADTDELFIVLEGSLDIHIREQAAPERVVHLEANDVFVVPRGIEHRPVSGVGASLMLLEPSETLSTGDFDGEIPEHIDSTTGRAIN